MIGTKILEERKSDYNGQLRVVRSWGLGTYIQSNGLTQSGGIVESMWKQTLSRIRHTNSKIQTVLVLGLGGGTVVKLIKKFWPGTKITGVDIDPVIVELGKKHLGLGDIEVNVKIMDASQYTKYNIQNTKYDLVIVDLYNGDEFPEKFSSIVFLTSIKHCLSKRGMAVFNRLYYKDKKREAEEFDKKLKKVFRKVVYFYPTVNVMFFCSK